MIMLLPALTVLVLVVTVAPAPPTTVQCTEDKCSSCYNTLARYIVFRDANMVNLTLAFFPPLQDIQPVFVVVNYQYDNESIEPQKWYWSQQSMFLLQPLSTFQFTSLFFGTPSYFSSEVTVTLPDECENASTGFMELLTQRLKAYTATQSLTPHISSSYDTNKGASEDTIVKFQQDRSYHVIVSIFQYTVPFFLMIFAYAAILWNIKDVTEWLNSDGKSSIEHSTRKEKNESTPQNEQPKQKSTGARARSGEIEKEQSSEEERSIEKERSEQPKHKSTGATNFMDGDIEKQQSTEKEGSTEKEQSTGDEEVVRSKPKTAETQKATVEDENERQQDLEEKNKEQMTEMIIKPEAAFFSVVLTCWIFIFYVFGVDIADIVFLCYKVRDYFKPDTGHTELTVLWHLPIGVVAMDMIGFAVHGIALLILICWYACVRKKMKPAADLEEQRLGKLKVDLDDFKPCCFYSMKHCVLIISFGLVALFLSTHSLYIVLAFIIDSYHATSVWIYYVALVIIYYYMLKSTYSCIRTLSNNCQDCCTPKHKRVPRGYTELTSLASNEEPTKQKTIKCCGKLLICICIPAVVVVLAGIQAMSIYMFFAVPINGAIDEAPNQARDIFQDVVTFITAFIAFKIWRKLTNDQESGEDAPDAPDHKKKHGHGGIDIADEIAAEGGEGGETTKPEGDKGGDDSDTPTPSGHHSSMSHSSRIPESQIKLAVRAQHPHLYT